MTSHRISAHRLSPDLSPGHGIDRDTPITLTVDGGSLPAYAGDSVASALLASGDVVCGPSLYRSRPRGLLAAGVEEPNALLRVEPRTPGSPSESMLPATTVEAVDGLIAHWLQGRGVLDPAGDDAHYDRKYVHTDVLVVGAGPAGIAAAREAAKTGARTILLDEQSSPGGSLLSGRDLPGRDDAIDGGDAVAWARATVDRLTAQPDAGYMPRTTAVGSYDANYIVAVERRAADVDTPRAAGVPRERVWHIRARRVVLATGAHERPFVFADNDRPGVMLAGAVRTYLNRYAVAAGRSVALATTDDSVYPLVEDLHAAGIAVPVVVDSRREPTPRARAALAATGVRGVFGAAVVGTSAAAGGAGDGPAAGSATSPAADSATGSAAGSGTAAAGRLTGVSFASVDDSGRTTGPVETVAADTLAVCGGHSPVLHLHTQRQGRTRWNEALAAFVPEAPVAGQAIVGAANGATSLGAALEQGARAGHTAAAETGAHGPMVVPAASAAETGPVRPLWLVAAPEVPAGDAGLAPELWDTHFVDLQRDQTVADVLRAVGAGMRSVEHIKRYTSISTANDQGKTSSVNAMGVIASLLDGADPASVGTSTNRPPYTPVAFAALAGRRRGQLYDPARVTNIHPWHVARGALFEDVGQWKRPWYYPRPGEDMDAAVLRECAAVRTSVGFQDVSTLGKIEIRGADAPEFLNRIYTNGFKKLAVDKGRYGLMCGADGMLFDDGVTMRLAEDRYLMTTTTGGAAGVLDWLEEWHQTEWPDMDVFFTSVTEQWNTIAVAGPRSRDVIAEIAPELDVSNDAFGFMEFRETPLSNGIPARICRISFSGELAFEVNVPTFYGLAAWELVEEAGREFGITPYGTETMHVLRAEKGLVIIGQDTDGTVTPLDAGMGWAVSKRKDFIGKRSFQREDTARPDRKHFVGVLPVDGVTRLDEGAQLIAAGTPVTPETGPVPMIGHVTSSYLSAELGRPFGLALVENGFNRMGEIVQSPVGGTLVDVEITSSVFVDPEGSRRDGDAEVRAGSAAGAGAGVDAGVGPAPRQQSEPQSLRRSPAHGLVEPMTEAAVAGPRTVSLGEITFAPQLGVRAAPGSEAAARLEHALGVGLPHAVGDSTGDPDGLHCVWISPDEFLTIDVSRTRTAGERVAAAGERVAAAGEQAAVTSEGVAAAAALDDDRPGAGRVPGQVVDLSGARTILELAGPHARAVLEKGCHVDLHPREFPIGCAVSTLVGPVPMIVHRAHEETFRLLPRSSFAEYTVRWLRDAMLEFSAPRA